VAAQDYLLSRGEPAEVIPRALGNEEGGLGHIVFARNGLQRSVGEPLLQGHNRGRISPEDPIGEGIDLKELEPDDLPG
jgi:hypothetical protein